MFFKRMNTGKRREKKVKEKKGKEKKSHNHKNQVNHSSDKDK
jgi:hypothetical protein